MLNSWLTVRFVCSVAFWFVFSGTSFKQIKTTGHSLVVGMTKDVCVRQTGKLIG